MRHKFKLNLYVITFYETANKGQTTEVWTEPKRSPPMKYSTVADLKYIRNETCNRWHKVIKIHRRTFIHFIIVLFSKICIQERVLEIDRWGRYGNVEVWAIKMNNVCFSLLNLFIQENMFTLSLLRGFWMGIRSLMLKSIRWIRL